MNKNIAELIKTYDDYLKLINESNYGPIRLAFAHGWRCSDEDVIKGQKYREQIEFLKAKIKDV